MTQRKQKILIDQANDTLSLPALDREPVRIAGDYSVHSNTRFFRDKGLTLLTIEQYGSRGGKGDLRVIDELLKKGEDFYVEVERLFRGMENMEIEPSLDFGPPLAAKCTLIFSNRHYNAEIRA